MMWLGRTTLTVVVLVAVLVGTGTAGAVAITFEDRTAGTYYFPGQNVLSDGVTISLSDYLFANGAIWPADVARIVNANTYGLSNNALALTGMNAAMSFGAAVQGITLQYAAINDTEGMLTINGQNLRFASSPVQLSGQTVGGVNVLAVAGPQPMQGYNMGTLYLTGSVSSLQIGGQNVMIDSIQVPEPATLSLLALGGLLLARKRK